MWSVGFEIVKGSNFKVQKFMIFGTYLIHWFITKYFAKILREKLLIKL